MTDEREKRGRGRPPRPMPLPIDADPEEIARVLMRTAPKKASEWRYLTDQNALGGDQPDEED